MDLRPSAVRERESRRTPYAIRQRRGAEAGKGKTPYRERADGPGRSGPVPHAERAAAVKAGAYDLSVKAAKRRERERATWGPGLIEAVLRDD